MKNSGLLPKKGWPERNYRFLRHQIVPGIFRKRSGNTVRPDFHPVAGESVSITWIGHASFLIQFEGMNILIDPNWALWHGIVKRTRMPGIPIDHLPPIDLILVSHAHYDHLHKKSLRMIDSRYGIIVPNGLRPLVNRLGFPAVFEMDLWEELQLGGVTITHTPSHHWGARMIHDTHRNFGGFILNAGGKIVYHAGDSAYFDDFKTIGARHNIDIAILPIGAYDAPSGRDVHMNPEEALQAFQDLGGETMIPMHYGTFPLGNESALEPEQRLIANAHHRGIHERVVVMEEGTPMVF
ncbi:MBL fold metallo-hydrolase [Sulfuriroseicoccus oceanibius]|uniref:MBL fold metallo-hydrolase n=1 Tax=Sulfuriroseicoccus oceanibius TaxID=2707525 RepID=A0A6B3LBC5_9BACT|nr:MBL fold metallo-hydrolase [Sulfuriroseicoccus oceanibius]QQL44166.1 MBL fold metallo-hydrolase [Sulfuriroseicoccus oceanibius]